MNTNNIYILFLLSFSSQIAFSADEHLFEFDTSFLLSSPLQTPSPALFDSESHLCGFSSPIAIDLLPTDEPDDSCLSVEPESEVIAFTGTSRYSTAKRSITQISHAATSKRALLPSDSDYTSDVLYNSSDSDDNTSSIDDLPKAYPRLLAGKLMRNPLCSTLFHLPPANKINKSYTCPHCTAYTTPAITNLERHMRNIHPEQANAKCSTCCKEFYTQYGSLTHECRPSSPPTLTEEYLAVYPQPQTDEEPPLPHARKVDSFYRCPYCNDYQSRALWHLNLHMRAWHSKTTAVPCPNCCIMTYTQEFLTLHQCKKAPKKILAKEPVVKKPVVKKPVVKKPAIVPKKIKRARIRKKSPPASSYAPPKNDAQLPPRTLAEFYTAIANLPHAEQKSTGYKCYHCKRKAESIGSLNRHQQSHKELEKVVCLFCKSKLYTQEHAYAHQCRCHEKSCCYIKKTFAPLIEHTQNQHPTLAIEFDLNNPILNSEAKTSDQRTEDYAILAPQLNTPEENGEIEFDIAAFFAQDN